MSDPRRTDPETERAMFIIAAFVGIPVAVVFLIAAVVQWVGPFMPVLVTTIVIAGVGYGIYRFQNSALTIRRKHEAEVLDRIGRAEAQQRELPQELSAEELVTALGRRGFRAELVPIETLLAPANAIYVEEFLSRLPPMPGVPLEAERVYDIDYDRRTLKKGEEPPYRLRTDSKGRPTSLELETFEDWLHRYVASTVNPAATITLFVSSYADLVAALLRDAPALSGRRTGFTVPLIDLLPNAKGTLGKAVDVLFQKQVKQWHHFSSVRAAFERNREKASQMSLRVRDIDAGMSLEPDKFPGTAREALEAYLVGTPLKALFLAEVPFAIPTAKRFEGHLVVARQGSGKTNALECLIYNDLAEVAAGRASLVVMDSQGLSSDALIGRLATLDYFGPGGPLEGKLIYLEPDLDYPLALNIFDIGMSNLGQLSTTQREAIVMSACEVVEFLFTGLLGGELSDNMTMLYRYLVPAMLAIPNADMNTFIELLDTETGRDRSPPPGYLKHSSHFGRLEPEVRSFLETDYLRDPELIKTKGAVRRRLRATLADTTFRRMFTQPRNKLNLFAELQSAKVILVNTFPAKNYVEQFGRLILALLMQATHQRLEIDREQRMPTFVYLDECQDYIATEERIAKYIDKCRKQNVGLTFATQRLSTIESPRVLNALGGVSIKFAGVSDADSSELATMVGSTAEHIRNLPRGRFSAYVSGVTPQAVDLTFPLSPLDAAPRLSKSRFEDVRAEMRSRYAVRYAGRGPSPSSARDDSTMHEAEVSEPKVIAPPRSGPQPAAKDDDTSIDDDYDPLR